MTTPDRIELNIFSWHSLINKVNLSSLLQAFESSGDLAPTHWSSDDSEAPRATYHPYDRDQFLAKVSDFDEYEEWPALYRKKQPQYEAGLSNNGLNLKTLSVLFNARLRLEDLPNIFTWSDALVSSLEAEYAFIDPFWDDIDYEYEHSAGIRAKEFQACGLISISARNWFGPHLVKLIGRERLYECGGYVQDTSWGGIRLDLVEEPWNADAETLSIAQREIKQNLESTGVFGDYSRVLRYKPGTNWKPIPQPTKSL